MTKRDRSRRQSSDARAVRPLLAVATDAERRSVDRAVTIESLGWIADKERLGWHNRLSGGVNYLEAPETLTGNQGILDVR